MWIGRRCIWFFHQHFLIQMTIRCRHIAKELQWKPLVQFFLCLCVCVCASGWPIPLTRSHSGAKKHSLQLHALHLIHLYLQQVLETIYSIPTLISCHACSLGQPSSVTHRNVRLRRNDKQLTHVPLTAFDRHRKFPNRVAKHRQILHDIGLRSFPAHASLSDHQKAANKIDRQIKMIRKNIH